MQTSEKNAHLGLERGKGEGGREKGEGGRANLKALGLPHPRLSDGGEPKVMGWALLACPTQ